MIWRRSSILCSWCHTRRWRRPHRDSTSVPARGTSPATKNSAERPAARHIVPQTWPAVSHISNLTVLSCSDTICVKNAAEQKRRNYGLALMGTNIFVSAARIARKKSAPPMVGSEFSTNWFLMNRRANEDFPTPESPSKTSLACTSGVPKGSVKLACARGGRTTSFRFTHCSRKAKK